MITLAFFKLSGPGGERRPVSLITATVALTTAVFGLCGLYGMLPTLNAFMAEFSYSGSIGLILGTSIMIFPLWPLERSRYRRVWSDRLLSTVFAYFFLFGVTIGVSAAVNHIASIQWAGDSLGGLTAGLVLGFLLATVLATIAHAANLAEILEKWWNGARSITNSFTGRVIEHCDKVISRLQGQSRRTVEGQALLIEELEELSDLISFGLPIVHGRGDFVRACLHILAGRRICIQLTRLQIAVGDSTVISDARFIRLMQSIRGHFNGKINADLSEVAELIDTCLVQPKTKAVKAKKSNRLHRFLHFCSSSGSVITAITHLLKKIIALAKAVLAFWHFMR